jgi:hypothetical protein
MGEIGIDGIGFDNRPGSSGLLERIRQLHHSRTILHVEFNLGLRVIPLESDLFYDGVKGLQVQRPFVRQVPLDGNTNFIISIGGTRLTPGQKNHNRKS